MLKLFEKHLKQNFTFLENKKLLIAISGGMDSVALTFLLHQLNYNISLAHCNFNLRDKESNLDETFVKQLAHSLKTPCFNTEFNTKQYCNENKTSIQIGARTLRYNWFKELCKKHEFDFILTAHHLNDVMETFFINLSRGTGIEGLTSIPAINNNIIRPLLIFSKKEIKDYLIENNHTWREDKSNEETKYLRNKIRHDIVPEFYKLNSNFEANFKLTLQNLYQSDKFIKQKIELIRKSIFIKKNETFYLLKSDLKSLSEYELYELLKPFGFNSSKEIIKLLNTQTGKEISSKTHQLLNNRENLILYSLKEKKTSKYLIKHKKDVANLPLKFSFSNHPNPNSNFSVLIHENAFPLTLRKKEDGDSFNPKGMKGTKKISKFLKDLKLSKIEKDLVWLLCNKHNQIIWVVGLRADGKETTKKEKSNALYINLHDI